MIISILDVGHDGEMTCSLNCNRQCTLMLCTVSGDSSGKDLASLRNILAQLSCILVIDLIIFFAAEYANFFSSASASSLHGRIRSFASVIVSHDGFLLHSNSCKKDQMNGSSSSIPSGIFIKPSVPAVSGAGIGAGAGAGALLCGLDA